MKASSLRFRASDTAWPCRCSERPSPLPPGQNCTYGPAQSVPGRDQWRLTRRLDLSPSSEVWLAEHPRTHEARVFKFAPDGVRLKSLKREVTLARLLRESLGERPEFVRILEWNFTSPPYFVESEYVGPNLAEWAEATGWARQDSAGNAMAAVSGRGPRRRGSARRWMFCTRI